LKNKLPIDQIMPVPPCRVMQWFFKAALFNKTTTKKCRYCTLAALSYTLSMLL